MNRIALLLLMLGLPPTFTLLGCSWIGEQPQKDSWYRPLPSELNTLDGWHEVPSADILVVDAAKTERAKRLLENGSWVRLPANQVAELTGGKMNEDAYLLRAVYWDDAPADHFVDKGFNVRTLGGNVHVHHQMLGRVTRMKRAAIMVRLPAAPKQLSVTCSTTL